MEPNVNYLRPNGDPLPEHPAQAPVCLECMVKGLTIAGLHAEIRSLRDQLLSTMRERNQLLANEIELLTQLKMAEAINHDLREVCNPDGRIG